MTINNDSNKKINKPIAKQPVPSTEIKLSVISDCHGNFTLTNVTATGLEIETQENTPVTQVTHSAVIGINAINTYIPITGEFNVIGKQQNFLNDLTDDTTKPDYSSPQMNAQQNTAPSTIRKMEMRVSGITHCSGMFNLNNVKITGLETEDTLNNENKNKLPTAVEGIDVEVVGIKHFNTGVLYCNKVDVIGYTKNIHAFYHDNTTNKPDDLLNSYNLDCKKKAMLKSSID